MSSRFGEKKVTKSRKKSNQVEGKSNQVGNQVEQKSNEVEEKSNQVQDSDIRLRHSDTDLATDHDTFVEDHDTIHSYHDTNHDTKRVPLTNKQKDIVNFCSAPRTSREILERAGVVYHTKNIAKYITSLVAAGYLQMTNPDNPTASNQKYKVKRIVFLDTENRTFDELKPMEIDESILPR